MNMFLHMSMQHKELPYLPNYALNKTKFVHLEVWYKNPTDIDRPLYK